jgi:hypothetical protein
MITCLFSSKPLYGSQYGAQAQISPFERPAKRHGSSARKFHLDFKSKYNDSSFKPGVTIAINKILLISFYHTEL